jgi:EAL domain-containing protein (putative c-di-GMP-specific phosphodiesterase class I)
LSYLQRLPAQFLKIDQSFVRDMLSSDTDRALVQAVIGLAQAFGREVVAEGVETHEHAAVLGAMGCDIVQGYGIARPMPAADLPAWVSGYRLPALVSA